MAVQYFHILLLSTSVAVLFLKHLSGFSEQGDQTQSLMTEGGGVRGEKVLQLNYIVWGGDRKSVV